MSSSNKKRGNNPTPSFTIPTSDCIYTSRLREGRRDYYTGVKTSVPKGKYDDDFIDTAPDTWTIQVGDLIAIDCATSLEPSKRPLPRKGIWYPFTTAWSPGQVIAIYQETKLKGRKGGEDYRMQIRWFYRKQDFPMDEDHQEGGIHQQLQHFGAHDSWKMVYETHVVEDYPIHSFALGKLVLTTYEHHALQGHFHHAKTGLPQVTHVCQYRVGKNDVVQKTDDWDTLYDWTPKYFLPDPLLRGLYDCPLSFSFHNDGLKKAYNSAILTKWLEDYRQQELKNPPSKSKSTASLPKKKKAVTTSSQKKKDKPTKASKKAAKPVASSSPRKKQANLTKSPKKSPQYATRSSHSKRYALIVPVNLNEEVAASAVVDKKDERKRPALVKLENAKKKNTSSAEASNNKKQIVPSSKTGRLAPRAASKPLTGKDNDKSRKAPPRTAAQKATRQKETGARPEAKQARPKSNAPKEMDATASDNKKRKTSVPKDDSSRRKRARAAPLEREKPNVSFSSSIPEERPKVRFSDDSPGKEEDLKTTEPTRKQKAKPKQAQKKTQTQKKTSNDANVRKESSQNDEPVKVGRLLSSTLVSEQKRFDFFESIDIQVRPEACARGVLDDRQPSWKLSVGDVICVACADSNPQAQHIIEKVQKYKAKQVQEWYPFTIPWSVGQVLAIFRDVDDGEMKMELRWFYRESDLSKEIRQVLPFELDKQVEEIFETNHVEAGFSVSQVLGRVELYFGSLGTVCDPDETGNGEIPTAQCRCRHFIPVSDSGKSLLPQPLFCAWNEPPMWRERMLERGLSISNYMKRHAKLKASTSKFLLGHVGRIMEPRKSKGHDNEDLISCGTPLRSPSRTKSGSSRSGRDYFTSLSIVPPWDNYYEADLIMHPKDRRNDVRWTLRVGDIVACHLDSEDNPEYYRDKESMWYPYSVPWCTCQVLAIYRDATGSGDTTSYTESDFRVEVRWLYRQKDLSTGTTFEPKFEARSKELRLEMLFESDVVEQESYDVKSLLGPVHLFSLGRTSTDVLPVSPFMPLALRMYCGEHKSSQQKNHGLKYRHFFSWQGIVSRGLKLSNHCRSKKGQKEVLDLLQKESPGNEMSTVEVVHEEADAASGPTKMINQASHRSDRQTRQSARSLKFTNQKSSTKKIPQAYEQVVHSFREEAADLGQSPVGSPEEESVSSDESTSSTRAEDPNERRIAIWEEDAYHHDLSSLRSYYRAVFVLPPRESYAKGLYAGREQAEDTAGAGINAMWKVEMGDKVAVKWEGKSRDTDFPFNEPWAAAEVVTIWREHDSADEINNLGRGRKSPSSLVFPSTQEDVMVELRWLYRKDELPGTSRGSTKKVDSEYEEVLETDHFDEDSAMCLLAPVQLHSSPTIEEMSRPPLGMPAVDFYCRRFWSIHRKSLVPCGSIEGMVDRGRMHSSHLGKDNVLRAALNGQALGGSVSLDEGKNVLEPSSHLDGFRKVIKKLSLIDASEATDVHGLRLIGREREQNKIVSFLKSAIRGEAYTDDRLSKDSLRKPSLFVAGPPGTGKTASVKSAVAQLRHEQAKGGIPEFEFVYLNGMEMRHPFEVYVKLWEKLSGNEKEKRSPGVAAALLERHFTQNGCSASVDGDDRHPVTVVLLDEIDYLVTRKQTVLYNFFDWPIRTASRESGPRLVVVGISNTLNLPERLKPSVQSRLGGERCDFASYKVDEMVKILRMKVNYDTNNSPSVFDEDAILFAARKTAALSGDVRKALQICKSAAEAVLTELEFGTRDGPSLVSIRDIQKVSRESFSSVMSKAVSLSAPYEALLLVSLASLTRSSGRGQGGFDMVEVMTKMESVATGIGDLRYMPPPTFAETLDMLSRLGGGRLVSLHTPKSTSATFRAAQGGSGGAWPLISLPMEDSNILTALRDSDHRELAEKYLGRSRAW